MRRRSRLAVTFVALLTVGWSVVTTQPSGSALAADPEAQLAETRAQLADAQSAQQALAATLERQRAELTQLQRRSADLDGQLDLARAELAAVTAEYDRVSGLLARCATQVADIEARLAELRAQIDALDARADRGRRRHRPPNRRPRGREALLQDHLRSAYERSQTSLLEMLLSADSLDAATTQVGYLMTVSDQDTALAEEIRAIRAELETRRETLQRRPPRPRRCARRRSRRGGDARGAPRRAGGARGSAGRAQGGRRAEARRAGGRAERGARGARATSRQQIAGTRRPRPPPSAWPHSYSGRPPPAGGASRRRGAGRGGGRAPRAAAPGAAGQCRLTYGFRWPERSFDGHPGVGTDRTSRWSRRTPISGTYYPHFHGGIDIAGGCGTPIYAAGAGVVVASGQPLLAVGHRLRRGHRPRRRRPDLVLAHQPHVVVVSPGHDRDAATRSSATRERPASRPAATSTSRSTHTASGRTRASTCPRDPAQASTGAPPRPGRYSRSTYSISIRAVLNCQIEPAIAARMVASHRCGRPSASRRRSAARSPPRAADRAPSASASSWAASSAAARGRRWPSRCRR